MELNVMNTEEKLEKRMPYTSPAIVYEGLVTARAGSLSPADDPGNNEAGIGPVDLFGNNG